MQWTHGFCDRPGCDGSVTCPNFPTIEDRLDMTNALLAEYAECENDDAIEKLLRDVILLYLHFGRRVDQVIDAVAEVTKEYEKE